MGKLQRLVLAFLVLCGAVLSGTSAPLAAQDMCRLTGQNCAKPKTASTTKPKPNRKDSTANRASRMRGITTYDLTFGTDDADRGQALVWTDDSHVMLAGYTGGQTDATARTGRVVKVHTDGRKVWEKEYPNDNGFEIVAIQSDSAGGAFLIGEGYQNANRSGLGVVMRIDQNGELLWKREFPGSGSVSGAASKLGDGLVVVAVRTNLDSHARKGGRHELFIWKLSPNGSTDWERSLGVEKMSRSEIAIRATPLGYLIAGEASHIRNLVTRSQRSEGLLIAVDHKGQHVWHRTYPGEGVRRFADVIALKQGGIMAAGLTFGPSHGGAINMLIQKFTASGDPIWARTYEFGQFDEVQSLTETIDGNYVIVGESTADEDSRALMVAMKISRSGRLLWRRTYGGETNDFGNVVLEMKDGGLLFGGSTSSSGFGNYDMWLVKTDANGRIEPS